MKIKCPHCKAVNEFDDHLALHGARIAHAIQKCSSCDEYFEVYFKVRFIGCATYGCNLYPADGETEESMMAAGVELDD